MQYLTALAVSARPPLAELRMIQDFQASLVFDYGVQYLSCSSLTNLEHEGRANFKLLAGIS
jgi:hypothetical protein